jgi:hypothetical protein
MLETAYKKVYIPEDKEYKYIPIEDIYMKNPEDPENLVAVEEGIERYGDSSIVVPQVNRLYLDPSCSNENEIGFQEVFEASSGRRIEEFKDVELFTKYPTGDCVEFRGPTTNTSKNIY